MGTSSKYYFSYLGIWNSEKFGRSAYLPFRISERSFLLIYLRKLKSLRILSFENLDILIFGTLNFRISDILKSWKVEDGHRELMKIPVIFPQNLGSEFHIYQKTWHGILITLYFQAKAPKKIRESECWGVLDIIFG